MGGKSPWKMKRPSGQRKHRVARACLQTLSFFKRKHDTAVPSSAAIRWNVLAALQVRYSANNLRRTSLHPQTNEVQLKIKVGDCQGSRARGDKR